MATCLLRIFVILLLSTVVSKKLEASFTSASFSNLREAINPIELHQAVVQVRQSPWQHIGN